MTIARSTKIGSRIIAALLMGFLVTAPGAVADEPGDTDAVFGAKAKELVAGKTARPDKITAVHAFVRDSIRQVTTQYG